MDGSSNGQDDALDAIRGVVQEVCGSGYEPVRPGDSLADAGLAGVELLACISLLEDQFGIEFPAELIPVMNSVDDLVYYTLTKRSQE